MAYSINKTDGTDLTTILDGTIDSTTDLTLIGKNYSGFGEAFNENLVKLLENFSSTVPPSKAIIGQLWYDTADGRLKVYSPTGWKSAGGSIVSEIQPINLNTGDIWIDNNEKQMYFYDGRSLTLAGPIWKDSQGITGHVTETLVDANGNAKPVLKMFVNNVLLGIYAAEPFSPSPSIPGFDTMLPGNTTTLVKGYNANSLIGSEFNISTTKTKYLVSEVQLDDSTMGEILLSHSSFMRTDQAASNDSKITVRNNSGITIGASSIGDFKIEGSTVVIENNVSGGQFLVRVRDESGPKPGIKLSSIPNRLGIFTDSPQYTVDLRGDLRVTGNLVVEGETINISVTDIKVEDKSLELSVIPDVTPLSGTITGTGTTTTITGLLTTEKLSAGMVLTKISGTGDFGGFTIISAVNSISQITITSTTSNTAGDLVFTAKGSTDAFANGGGIIVKGTTDKSILYSTTTTSFDISENINLASGKSIKINNVEVLNGSSLTSAITSAPGITSVGPQVSLTVDDIFINDNRISSLQANQNVEIEPTGSGNLALIGSPRITGLGAPVDDNDGASKIYTEQFAKALPLSLSLIENGLGDSQIIAILTDIAPPALFVAGKKAYIHLQNLSTGPGGIAVARSLKIFHIVGLNWELL